MEINKIKKRSQIIASIFVVVVAVFCVYLVQCSTSFAGLNVKTDELRKSTVDKLLRQTVMQGFIYDKDGVLLSEGIVGKKLIYDEKTKEKKYKDYLTSRLTYPEEYSWLLGYVHGDNSCGLKGKYEQYLYREGKDSKGADIQLTLNNKLQRKAYETIEGNDESAIVLDVHTGKVLALASAKETEVPYNVNDEAYGTNYSYWSKKDAGFFKTNGIQDAAEPGSVFKLVTASAILENGREKDTVKDTGTVEIGNGTVSNNGKVARGKIGLQEALGYSSNIFFAKEALKMNGTVLEEQADKFLIGQNIDLDFTTLQSNFDLGNNGEEIIAATAYGQGNTLMTPLHIAMVAQAIANNGKMLKPYMVEKIVQDKKTILKGKEESLGQTVSRRNAKKLKTLLKNVATDYYGIDSDLRLCAKTGTSQIAGGKYKCYFLAFSDDYVVLVSKVTEDTEEYGRHLQSYVLDIFKYLSSTQ
nr:penicillin-binding transpeptidase domain-containing protein [uncultured Anaerobutyricum sp.]